MTIPKLVLDPRNDEELLAQAYLRVSNASAGTLNANQPGSALMALLEGQTYLTAELLWYVNLLPEALAIEVMRLTGVERVLSTVATGSFLITLSTVLGTPFVISEGTVLGSYVTTETMVISAGGVSASVAIAALQPGSQGNAVAYSINLGAVTTYVQAVFNDEAITGGSDLETLEDYLVRVQASLRIRDTLVTEEDYTSAATTLAGGTGIAVSTCFPLIAANRSTKEVGNAHVFVAYKDLSVPSETSLYNIQTLLQERCYIASSVWVSAATYLAIELDIVVQTTSLEASIADNVYTALKAYIAPGEYEIGSTLAINELEYITRTVTGVNRVTSLFLNSGALNLGMPSFYTYPKLDGLTITLVDNIGRSVTYYRGLGDGDTV